VRPWLVPARRAVEATRATEATPEQLVATGAMVGGYGRDPIDGDTGYRPAGQAGRAVPYWTAEKARTVSVASYRSNPMARAIVDTYTSFCVGDKGLTLSATNPLVAAIAQEFWDDPRNQLGSLQTLLLRDLMIMGEQVLELMTGDYSGAVRFSPIDPQSIAHVNLLGGNPLWPDQLYIRSNIDGTGQSTLKVAQVNDLTGLREGQAMYWRPWRALLTDVRSEPFLMPVLDWLDSYDQVLSNLIDRTAMARYFAFDVTVQGGQDAVDKFVAARGGLHVPPSASIEVHNESVEWKPMNAPIGAFEDSQTAGQALTNIASGAGLSKTWLAEPDGANRATSLTMAEPVRRRVRGVQTMHLAQQTELARYAIDRAVAARRLPAMLDVVDPATGQMHQLPAAQAVSVTGPEIAAADAQVNAQVLLNLSTALEQLELTGALPPKARAIAAKKAWEDYVGTPYVASLDTPDPSDPAAARDDLATHIDEQSGKSAKVRSIRSRTPVVAGAQPRAQ
jgi:hypothetical protein